MGILHGGISNCELNCATKRHKRYKSFCMIFRNFYAISGLFRFTQRSTDSVLKTAAIPINPYTM